MTGHLMLNISFNDKHIEFYKLFMEMVGFECVYSDNDIHGGAISFRRNEFNLWVKYENKKLTHKFNREIGVDHIAFHVESKKDVDGVYDKLISQTKVTITIPPKFYPKYSPNYYAFYFRDYDGIPLEVMTK